MIERRKFATQNQHAYEVLRRWIITRKLVPGERIVIDKVAADLDMSNIPVRDALRELAAEHLVMRVGGRGWAVTSLSPEEMEAACAIRQGLEIEAARRCALKATPQDIERLREIAERSDALMTQHRRDEAEEPDWAFHLEVARIAAGPKLRSELNAWLFVLLEPLAMPAGFGDGDATHGHVKVADAIATGDPDLAERVMRRHVSASEEVIAKGLLQQRAGSGADAKALPAQANNATR